MTKNPLRSLTLLVLFGVLIACGAALGGQSKATLPQEPSVSKQPSTLSLLVQSARLHLGVWFGIQFDPPAIKGGKPAVTSPTNDGPEKSQTGPDKWKKWITEAMDTGGAGAEK
jgi:hypothetical protein